LVDRLRSLVADAEVFVESHGFRQNTSFPPADGRRRPHDAVAALLVTKTGRYIMQLRDGKAGDFLSGALGLLRRGGRSR